MATPDTTEPTRAEALQALGEWVEDNYTSITDALRAMAHRCNERAQQYGLDGNRDLARTMLTASDDWMKRKRELRHLYRAIPVEIPDEVLDQWHADGYDQPGSIANEG